MTSKAVAEKEILPLVKGVITKIHCSEDEESGEDYIGMEIKTGSYQYLMNFHEAAMKTLTSEQKDEIQNNQVDLKEGIKSRIVWFLRDFEDNGPGAWEIQECDKKEGK